MGELKAIPTRYKGHVTRSRLEARWMVFWDHLGVEWQYEAEGYQLGEAGWYLPDFWLPNQEWFVEVKGQRPTTDEAEKCGALAQASGKMVLLVVGLPNTQETVECYCHWTPDNWSNPHPVELAACRDCGRLAIRSSGFGGYGVCPNWCAYHGENFRGYDTFYSEWIDCHALATRAARFEHGETG